MTMKKALRFLASVALIVVPLFSRAQTVVDTVPFFCDFEDTVLNTHWHLENGSCYNFFVIDTSVNTTPGGSKSLYDRRRPPQHALLLQVRFVGIR